MGFVLSFQKSIMSYFVLKDSRGRLFSGYHTDILWTSSMWAVLSPPEMSLTAVVSSANAMMVSVELVRAQSWV